MAEWVTRDAGAVARATRIGTQSLDEAVGAHARRQPAPERRAGPPPHRPRLVSRRGRHLPLEVRQLRAGGVTAPVRHGRRRAASGARSPARCCCCAVPSRGPPIRRRTAALRRSATTRWSTSTRPATGCTTTSSRSSCAWCGRFCNRESCAWLVPGANTSHEPHAHCAFTSLNAASVTSSVRRMSASVCAVDRNQLWCGCRYTPRAAAAAQNTLFISKPLSF